MSQLVERIGVVGNGFVGKAIARGFLEHAGEVRIYDIDPARRTHSLVEALDCNFVFVAVPTPQADGAVRCDTSIIDGVLAECAAIVSGPLWPDRDPPRMVIKSTVPLGYTRAAAFLCPELTLLHSPEFLTQRCAHVDFQTPARNIIGIPGYPAKHWATVKMAANDLAHLFERRFPGVPCLIMSSDESELVKLAQNSFFAVKVAYFNLIQQLAETLGLHAWENVRAGMLSDGRIAHAHTSVPGPDGVLGFGGACLPKDTASLAQCLSDAGQDPASDLLRAVLLYNQYLRGGG